MRSVMWITDTCLGVLDGPLYDSGHSSRLPLTPAEYFIEAPF